MAQAEVGIQFQYPPTNHDQVAQTVKIHCPQHPSQHFVFICLLDGCQKPLCSLCKQSHSLEHKNVDTPESRASFSEHLRTQAETLRLLIQKSRDIKSVIRNQLRQSREKYLSIINDHFDSLDKAACEIELQSQYLQDLQRNYKQLQEGKSYFITEDVEDQNIPELVSSVEEFGQFVKKYVYIRPGIQIVPNEDNQVRRRHHSEKINFPKAHWVNKEDIEDKAGRDLEVKSHGSKKMASTNRVAYTAAKDNKAKKLLLNTHDVNKSFQIKDIEAEDVINFREKASTKVVPPNCKLPTTPIQFSKHRSNIRQELVNNPEAPHRLQFRQ